MEALDFGNAFKYPFRRPAGFLPKIYSLQIFMEEKLRGEKRCQT